MGPEGPAGLKSHGQQGDQGASEHTHEQVWTGEPVERIEHVDTFFTRMVADPNWLSTPEVRHAIGSCARHLGECEHCQVFLEVLLRNLAVRATPKSESEAASLRLLERLRMVGERTRARKQLSAYALKWCAHDEDAARAAFPETSAHLETCAICRREVVDRLGALRAQMDALLTPRLDLAPPADTPASPLRDQRLAQGVERLARRPIKGSEPSHVASPTLIVGVGAAAGEVCAALGRDVLEMSADDRQRIALVALTSAEPTFAWHSLRREQRERQLMGHGPWLAEARLDAPEPTPLTLVFGDALRALPRAGAEEPPRVLLMVSLAEADSAQRATEVAATIHEAIHEAIHEMASQHDLAPHLTVLCVPSGAGDATPRPARAASQHHQSAATPWALFNDIWLVGMDAVSRAAFASALSRQVRAWLRDTAGGLAKFGPPSSRRSSAQRHAPPRVYARMAAEFVFPLEETALSFALRSAAAVLPELAVREGLPRHDTVAPQAQLAAMEEMMRADWKERTSHMPDTRHLFDPLRLGNIGPGFEYTLERLYSWATLGTGPYAERDAAEAVVAAHLDDCLEALRVARQSTTAAQEDASEDTIGWLALTLVGYFRWFYFEKLRALDLCELLLRSGQAATLDECAALLTKRAIALQRWLASTTPRAPDDVATSHPSAGTLSVSLQGQPHAGWRGMADSLREALGQAVEPGIAVTLDKTLADPHRLRLWFTRPLRDLAKHDDPLAWLAEGCGPLDQARAPQRKTPTPRP